MPSAEYIACQRCGGALDKGKRFCSKECWRAFTSAEAESNRKPCARCGQPVRTRGKKVKFCSRECARLASRGRTLPAEQRAKIAESNRRTKAARKKPPKPCIECGRVDGGRSRGMCRTCYARSRYKADAKRNGESAKEYYRRRYRENRESHLAAGRRWREANPDYYKQERLRRAVLERQQKAYFAGLRDSVVERDEATCQDCGRDELGPRQLHVHHIDSDKANNSMENLIVLCSSCHAKRHYAQGDLAIGGSAANR